MGSRVSLNFCTTILLLGFGVIVLADESATSPADEARRYKWDNKAITDDPKFDRDLNLAISALKDYANGGKMNSIPLQAMQSMSAQLGRLVPHTPSYFTGEDGPVLSTSDVKREPRYALALAPVACETAGCEGCSEYEASLCQDTLPDPRQVWERLLRRENDRGESQFVAETGVPVNMMMLTMVNWFHDDTFRTQHGTNGSKLWKAKDGISLAQVYGDSSARERALRTLNGGKMRTSRARNGETLPPRLEDVRADHPDFEMWNTTRGIRAAANVSDMFALGDPRFNMHPGHLFWGTVALRLHNQLCDIVLEERPGATDDEVFGIARHLLTHIVNKVRTEDFVSDTIAPFRDHARIAYNPPEMRTLTEFRSDLTPIWFEFKQLYHWHSMIPDAFDLGPAPQSTEEDGQERNELLLQDAMFNPAAFDLHTQGLGPLGAALKRTRLGRYGPRNTPRLLEHATLRALHDGRKQRLQSFNSYRRYFGLDPHQSFADFGMDAESTEAMRQLYGSPDKVDYFVGIMCEVGQASGGGGRIRHNLLGDAQLALVALFAVQDIVSLDHVRLPELWSPRLLTAKGRAFVEGFDLAAVLADTLGPRLSGPALRCPFLTDDSACTPRSQLRDARARELRWENLSDFAGLDYLARWFWDDTGHYMAQALCATLASLLVVVALYLAASPLCLLAVEARFASQPAAPLPLSGCVVLQMPCSVHPQLSPTRTELLAGSAGKASLACDEAEEEALSQSVKLRGSADTALSSASSTAGTRSEDSFLFNLGRSEPSAEAPAAEGLRLRKAANAEGVATAGSDAGEREAVGREARLATVASVNCAVSMALAGPVSYWSARVLLSDDMQAEVRAHFLGVCVGIFAVSVLYAAEATVRAASPTDPRRDRGGRSWQRTWLYVHHLGTVGLTLAGPVLQSVWVFRLGVLLAWFALLEFPLYLALALYRLRLLSDHALKTVLFPVCGVVYLGSRAVEGVMLVSFLSLTAPRMMEVGQGAVFFPLAVLSLLLLAMQLQVLAPFYHMYSRLGRRH